MSSCQVDIYVSPTKERGGSENERENETQCATRGAIKDERQRGMSRRRLGPRIERDSRFQNRASEALNGFAGSRGRGRFRERAVRILVLVGGLVDFDGAFEVGAVLDHDPRGGQIAVHRTVLLDLDAVLGAQIALHGAVDHNFAGDNIGGHFRGRADSELPLVELDQSFDRAIDLQIFAPSDFALHMQAGTEPRARTPAARTQWTHCISSHNWFLLPRCRSRCSFWLRLRRLIRNRTSWRRLRTLRRIRFLISPHQSLTEQTPTTLTDRGRRNIRPWWQRRQMNV